MGGALAQALEGFRDVWNHNRVRTSFALFAVVGVFGWSYSVLMPAFAHDVLHLGERGYGLLLGATGVGALIGALTTEAFGSVLQPRTTTSWLTVLKAPQLREPYSWTRTQSGS